MIDVDLRRYGTDKEYEKFVNGIISGADIDETPVIISISEVEKQKAFAESFKKGLEAGLKGEIK